MWYNVKEQDVIVLYVYVKPNAKQSAITAVSDNEVHIALHAKPQDGAANATIKQFISNPEKLIR